MENLNELKNFVLNLSRMDILSIGSTRNLDNVKKD